MLCATFHGDFHHGKIKVLTSAGTWEKPFLLAFLDDYSRLVCHAQWYLEETAEAYVHCLSQAFYKFGLPRGVMSDNGSPMTAGESEEGLLNLGILGPHSEAYKPNQNGNYAAIPVMPRRPTNPCQAVTADHTLSA